MKDFLNRWLDGEFDAFEQMPDIQEGHDLTLDKKHELKRAEAERLEALPKTQKIAEKERKAFHLWYMVTAFVCCLTLMTVFLYMTAHIKRRSRHDSRLPRV